jgi:hypothetical protein
VAGAEPELAAESLATGAGTSDDPDNAAAGDPDCDPPAVFEPEHPVTPTRNAAAMATLPRRIARTQALVLQGLGFLLIGIRKLSAAASQLTWTLLASRASRENSWRQRAPDPGLDS